MRIRSLTLAVLAGLSFGVSAQTLSNYQAVVASQSPRSWYKFDAGTVGLYYITNNVASNPTYLTVAGALGDPGAWLGGFAADVYDNPGAAVYFSGQFDILDVAPDFTSTGVISGGGGPGTGSTAVGSVSCMFRTLNPGLNTGRRYVFSAGGDTSSNAMNALTLFFEGTNVANGDPNCLKFRFGDSSQVILQYTNLVPNGWYYFAATYTESSATSNKAAWYLGRPGQALASGVTSNAPEARAGDGIHFMIGNHTNYSSPLRNPGAGRVDEFATWNRRLSTNEILAQFATLPDLTPPPLAPYQAAISNQSPTCYFKFERNYRDSVGGSLVLDQWGVGNTFGYDLFGINSNAYLLTGPANNSGLYVTNANLLTGGGGTNGQLGVGRDAISLLFYTLGTTNVNGQKRIFSAGGNIGYSNALSLYVDNLKDSNSPSTWASLGIGAGNTNVTILYATNMVLEGWYYFAMNFDETRTNQQVNWWLGRPGKTLLSGNVDLAYGVRAGMGNTFFIGQHTNVNGSFRDGNYWGRIDEFAIWHRLLTGTEVTNQFNALAVTPPVPVTPPTLGITAAGGTAIIAWPAGTDPGYALESTTNVAATNWVSAGTPVVIGTNYVVTNAIPPSARFYRLKK